MEALVDEGTRLVVRISDGPDNRALKGGSDVARAGQKISECLSPLYFHSIILSQSSVLI